MPGKAILRGRSLAGRQTKGRQEKEETGFLFRGKASLFLFSSPSGSQSTSLALLCALSCAWALEEKGFHVLLQAWPNDILFRDKKVEGFW